MAFGLTGAPATFQKAMNATLELLLRKCVLVFFDDILVYSASLKDHLLHLQQVLGLLDADHWKVKMSKCSFAKNQIDYLDHIVSAQGVATDLSKVLAIASWHVPTSVKELRSFLGMAGYYRNFLRHFGIISMPLTNLLKKNTLFVWISEHQLAFISLKNCLVTTRVLTLLDFSKTFVIETNTCAVGVGAVLMQAGTHWHFLAKLLDPSLRDSPHMKRNSWPFSLLCNNGAHICNKVNSTYTLTTKVCPT
jgi:hypothetical protein